MVGSLISFIIDSLPPSPTRVTQRAKDSYSGQLLHEGPSGLWSSWSLLNVVAVHRGQRDGSVVLNKGAERSLSRIEVSFTGSSLSRCSRQVFLPRGPDTSPECWGSCSLSVLPLPTATCPGGEHPYFSLRPTCFPGQNSSCQLATLHPYSQPHRPPFLTQHPHKADIFKIF